MLRLSMYCVCLTKVAKERWFVPTQTMAGRSAGLPNRVNKNALFYAWKCEAYHRFFFKYGSN